MKKFLFIIMIGFAMSSTAQTQKTTVARTASTKSTTAKTPSATKPVAPCCA